MSRMLSVWIDDDTEARLVHAVAHHEAGGPSVEWYAEGAISETAAKYADSLSVDPAEVARDALVAAKRAARRVKA